MENSTDRNDRPEGRNEEDKLRLQHKVDMNYAKLKALRRIEEYL